MMCLLLLGELLETTLERVPRLRPNSIDRGGGSGGGEGLEWYRKIMTTLGDKTIGERLQQRLSRQLAELLLRSRPDAEVDSQSVVQKNQLLGYELFPLCNTRCLQILRRIESQLLLSLFAN
jgi:hypothetical protein